MSRDLELPREPRSCFFLLRVLWVFVLRAQSCLALCDPRDCSPPGSSVHGILQARTLECVAMPSSRGSFQHRDQTPISCISGNGRPILYHGASWEAHLRKFGKAGRIGAQDSGGPCALWLREVPESTRTEVREDSGDDRHGRPSSYLPM